MFLGMMIGLKVVQLGTLDVCVTQKSVRTHYDTRQRDTMRRRRRCFTILQQEKGGKGTIVRHSDTAWVVVDTGGRACY